ncbi:MAG: hypothetical protein ACYTAF_14065, partial [Planctomycetota bacterium]
MRTFAIVAVIVLLLAAGGYYLWWQATHYVEEVTDYSAPEKDAELTDDKIEDKNPDFDRGLVDSRPLGEWEVNKSAAVIALDCPMMKPDQDAPLFVLSASYADAMKAAGSRPLLPSANMLDGAAKQFDDGLYAALDLACFHGKLGIAPSAPDVVEALFAKLPPKSPSRTFLAAALQIAGRKMKLENLEAGETRRLVALFEGDRARSKPIAFYTWSPELGQVWKFFRFLQQEFGESGRFVLRDVAAVLRAEPDLAQQYMAVNSFYGRLTNPLICLPLDLVQPGVPLEETAKKVGAKRATMAVFPPSTSRSTELFNKLFPEEIPSGTNLMNVLIQRIRSGEVDLKPDANAGWYQYQVYALETLLMPSRGQEEDKLLLTANYKKRLVEAFKALMTKRRETHSRQLAISAGETTAPPPLQKAQVRPRLRVEPCATFYLRTARAYGFLQNFLLSTVGEEKLAPLTGLKNGGARELSVAQELSATQLRFYGFYFIACEDIGMRPQLLEDEDVDREECMRTALAWLEGIAENPDLACDTRVSVPIAAEARKTRLWATLGVRLAFLEAEYARPPKVRPKVEGGDWQDVEPHQLGESKYVIAVDEF